jgi:hypothetical protein
VPHLLYQPGDRVRLRSDLVAMANLPASWKVLEGRLTRVENIWDATEGLYTFAVPKGVRLWGPDGNEVVDLRGNDASVYPPFCAGDRVWVCSEFSFSGPLQCTVIRPAPRNGDGRQMYVCSDGREYADYELEDFEKPKALTVSCRHHGRSTDITVPAPHLLPASPLGAVAEQEAALTQRSAEPLRSAVRAKAREWPICSLTRGEPALVLRLAEDRVKKTITGIWHCQSCSKEPA